MTTGKLIATCLLVSALAGGISGALMASVKRGPAGPQGPQGERGERGPQGEQGEKGETPTCYASGHGEYAHVDCF